MSNQNPAPASLAVGKHADQVRALFDRKAGGWPAKYGADGALTGRLALLASTVRDRTRPGGELLDLGCGSGELARSLAADGYVVTGCDIAPAMLRQATEADPTRVVRWIGLAPHWEVLPFPSGRLDVVVAASVLEYLREPATVLAECARVLRPGGVLVCTVPNLAHPVRWLEWPLRLAARSPACPPALAALAAGSTARRGQEYLTYLRVSCQRRRASWWYRAAREAGLQPVATRRQPRQPLRLLVLARPAGRGPQNLEEPCQQQ